IHRVERFLRQHFPVLVERLQRVVGFFADPRSHLWRCPPPLQRLRRAVGRQRDAECPHVFSRDVAETYLDIPQQVPQVVRYPHTQAEMLEVQIADALLEFACQLEARNDCSASVAAVLITQQLPPREHHDSARRDTPRIAAQRIEDTPHFVEEVETGLFAEVERVIEQALVVVGGRWRGEDKVHILFDVFNRRLVTLRKRGVQIHNIVKLARDGINGEHYLDRLPIPQEEFCPEHERDNPCKVLAPVTTYHFDVDFSPQCRGFTFTNPTTVE